MRIRLVEAVQLKQNKTKTITILSQAEEYKFLINTASVDAGWQLQYYLTINV